MNNYDSLSPYLQPPSVRPQFAPRPMRQTTEGKAAAIEIAKAMEEKIREIKRIYGVGGGAKKAPAKKPAAKKPAAKKTAKKTSKK